MRSFLSLALLSLLSTGLAGCGGDTTTDDSAGDPDNDGLSNLEEYRTGRDPHVRNGTWVTVNRCGCASAPGPRLPWLVPLLFLILRRRDDVPTC